jgi:hypothetical protein
MQKWLARKLMLKIEILQILTQMCSNYNEFDAKFGQYYD